MPWMVYSTSLRLDLLRPADPCRPGDVREDVDTAVLAVEDLEDLPDLPDVGDVPRERVHALSEPRELVGSGVEPCCVDVDEQQVGSGLGVDLRDGPADVASSP